MLSYEDILSQFKTYVNNNLGMVSQDANIVVYVKPKLIKELFCNGSDYKRIQKEIKDELNRQRKRYDSDAEEKEDRNSKKAKRVNSAVASRNLFHSLSDFKPISLSNKFDPLSEMKERIVKFNEETESQVDVEIIVNKFVSIKNVKKAQSIDLNKIISEHKMMMELKNELFENLKKTNLLRQELEQKVKDRNDFSRSLDMLKTVEEEERLERERIKSLNITEEPEIRNEHHPMTDEEKKEFGEYREPPLVELVSTQSIPKRLARNEKFVTFEKIEDMKDEHEKSINEMSLIISTSDAQCQTNFSTMTKAGRQIAAKSDSELAKLRDELEEKNSLMRLEITELKKTLEYNKNTMDIMEERITHLKKNQKDEYKARLSVQQQKSWGIETANPNPTDDDMMYLRLNMITSEMEKELNQKRRILICDIILHSMRIIVRDTKELDRVRKKAKRTKEDTMWIAKFLNCLTDRVSGAQEHFIKSVHQIYDSSLHDLEENHKKLKDAARKFENHSIKS
jgi:hypothetical protein